MGVGSAILAARLFEDARVAGRFLVEAEGAVGKPGERVEPLQAKKNEGDVADDEVARAMVRELVVERQAALMRVVAVVEINWQRDDPVEDSKSHRSAHRRA